MQTDTIRLRELRITYAVRTDRDGQPITAQKVVNNSQACGAIFLEQLQNEPSEVFSLLCLSSKCRLLAYHEVSRGTLDSALAHPREIFRAAILANAASIVVGHNHPSGDPLPSSDDVALTRRLVAAGAVMGIPVVDHIVVGDGRFFSFRDAHLLPGP
jgi:DNA repair protein RadC